MALILASHSPRRKALLDLSAAVYHDAATFTDIKVEAYKPWAT